ncbi:hypothetical protein V2J09_009543 [Rumex salicifolius]
MLLCRLLQRSDFSKSPNIKSPFNHALQPNPHLSQSLSIAIAFSPKNLTLEEKSFIPSTMETPASTRRITRSQARSALTNSTNNLAISKNGEETEKNAPKSRAKSALIDITNDSPIVGLAGKSIFSESKTPLSAVSKQRRNVPKSTPGSGERLLRGQVKTLLQKVEEEAEISRFLGSIKPQFLGQTGFINSPSAILAPTPANTPQVLGSFEQTTTIVDDFATEIPIQDQLKVSQVVSDLFDVKMMVESNVDSEKSCLITRSLLLDFSEKSDLSTEEKSSTSMSDCSSAVTYQLSAEKSPSVLTAEDAEEAEEEEDASVWSIQVNASIRDEDEDEDEEEDIEPEEEEEYDDEEEEGDDGFMDEICAGMSKISVGEIRFEGKHTRFVYNNEDEIEKEEEVVHLKGLPTPKGKHLRFALDEDEEEEEES